MLTWARHVLRRTRQERLPQTAGSLTLTTLLSLVPLLAVGLWLFARWPALFGRFERALDELLLTSLMPPEIARTVLTHLHRFAANADALPWLGYALLLASALALLLTVENTLNRIWGVKRQRPLPRRVGLILPMLVLGPPALALTLGAASALLGATLGWLGPLPPAARILPGLGPALLTWIGAAALFYFVPNTRVRRRDAIAGGLIASAALELGKRAFAAWLLELPAYRALYGAFAVLPVFLLWLYFSWLVTLSAALVAASLGRVTTAARR